MTEKIQFAAVAMAFVTYWYCSLMSESECMGC